MVSMVTLAGEVVHLSMGFWSIKKGIHTELIKAPTCSVCMAIGCTCWRCALDCVMDMYITSDVTSNDEGESHPSYTVIISLSHTHRSLLPASRPVQVAPNN